MVHALEHHGLVKVPLGDTCQPAGIYWLRSYKGAPRCVAVLTEVPGNPSLSVTNAISRVSAFVADRFLVDLSELDKQGVGDKLEAGRHFWGTLSPETCALCRYHKADWAAIAEESVRVIEQLGPRDDDHDYVAAAQGSHLPRRDKEWLRSLFADPVVIAGGGYTNGQHRGCALHFSGAERAAVVTDLEPMGFVDTDEVYLGEG